MGNARHFIKLDLLAFKPYRIYLLFSFFPMISVFIIKSMAALTGESLALMISFMIITHLFASEEKNGMARLYGSLPMNKKDVVIGRYINCILMGLGCILVSALLMGLCCSFIPEIKFSNVVFYYSVILGIFLICLVIQLPLMFELGYTKGQLPAMILPVLVLYALMFTGGNFLKPLSSFQNYLGIILTFAGLLSLAVSLCISIVIYRNKQA